MKVCSNCKKEKPLEHFWRSALAKKATQCKTCIKSKRKLAANTSLVKEKKCAGCHAIKPISEFHKGSINKDGHTSRCKICSNNYVRLQRKNGCRKLNEKVPVNGKKRCKICKKIKYMTNFTTYHDNTDGRYTYCNTCKNNKVRAVKQTSIDYKGGSCEICGYNKCIAALDFHHVNPSEKDFTIGNRPQWGFPERLKKELDKCILLCANCHRELHAKETT